MSGSTLCTRRQFGLSMGGSIIGSRLFGAERSMPWAGPAVVKRVYLAVPKPSWPRPDLDVQSERAEIEATLTQLVERKHDGLVRLTGGDLVRTAEDAQAFVKGLGDVDGVLIIDLTSQTSGLLAHLGDIQAPMLLYARPYSGWSYVDVVHWLQSGKRADLVVTSEPGDLDPYMRIFRTIHHLRTSKVLVVNTEGRDPYTAAFSRQFGTSFGFPTYADLKAAFDAADPGKAQTAASEFTRGALRVIEPSAGEIAAALRFYHAVSRLLDQEKANAITVDCLGGFKRGDLAAYPCVAWSKLNDQGLYGVCEADVLSTMSQLLLTSFCGKPGFVSDPVFDTSRSEIIHAHCVASTSMQGIGGPSSPYVIRSHMEDNKGVSMQVLLPIQDTITVCKFLDPGTFGVSTAEVVGNVDNPRGCRTKIRTRVADARKLLEGYRGALHRVIFYGDYVRPIEQMGHLLGFKVVHEGEGPDRRLA